MTGSARDALMERDYWVDREGVGRTRYPVRHRLTAYGPSHVVGGCDGCRDLVDRRTFSLRTGLRRSSQRA